MLARVQDAGFTDMTDRSISRRSHASGKDAGSQLKSVSEANHVQDWPIIDLQSVVFTPKFLYTSGQNIIK